MSSPVSLLHERQKHIKARSQANLTKKVLNYFKVIRDFETELSRVPSEELSLLFTKQQSYLPSYARDKVSWSHIEALESRRIQEGFYK